VDDCLGKLFDTLEKTGQLESTSIVITGDHGYDYAGSPRGRKHVAIRNYREDIEVPMVLMCDFETRQNVGEIAENGMIDSMGVCASFLDALDVPQHQSFKGKSVFRGGREAVISENAGSGNADIDRRDLYFTVTTEGHKLMTVLVGSELQLLHLYDLQNDPDELVDLLGQDNYEKLVHPLVSTLMQERGEIFQLRNAAPKLSRQEWRLAS
jgi:arylsulfatase A-like enzyme